MTVSFWFEFASTYSYPSVMRVESVAASHGVSIQWRPFLLGPIFRKHGWEDSPFNLYSAKGRYMWRDLERICARYGLAFRKPSQFPRNGLLASRIACEHADQDWCPEFIKAVYRANFEHDQDIGDPSVVAECLPVARAEVDDVIARATSDAAKLRLRQQTEFAESAGIFGAPSMLVGEELFWGDDRLEQAFEFAAGGQA